MAIQGRRGRGFLFRVLASAALFAAFAPLAAAEAETPRKPPLAEQLLEILRAKDLIDDQQYQDLLEQARQEAAERATPAVSAAAAEPAPKPDWDFGWKNTFYAKKSDGSMSLKFGGRIENDAAVVNESPSLARAIGGVGTGTEFRRARIFFEGNVYENAIFKAEYDFAEGEAGFRDVWVGLRDLPYVGRIRAGHMKEPFSIDQMTSDKYDTFMERALPDAFAPGRNTGLMANRTFASDRIYFGAGAFADTDDFGDAFANDSNYNVAARLTGLPLYEESGKRLLHMGVSYEHGFRGDGTIRFRHRPEAHLAPVIVDTRNVTGVSGVDRIGGEIAGVFGPVSFQSEVSGAFVDRGIGLTNPAFWGAYGQLSWFITGETRAYDPTEAVFARTSPKHPFSVKNGTWGAFEVALRYSYLTLDDGGISGGIVNDVTGGLNWILYPNLRLMFNYVYSKRHGLGDASIAQSRVQFDF